MFSFRCDAIAMHTGRMLHIVWFALQALSIGKPCRRPPVHSPDAADVTSSEGKIRLIVAVRAFASLPVIRFFLA